MFWKAEIPYFHNFVIRSRTVPRKFLKYDPRASTFRISYNLIVIGGISWLHISLDPSFRPTSRKVGSDNQGAELVNLRVGHFFLFGNFESTLILLWKKCSTKRKKSILWKKTCRRKILRPQKTPNLVFSASQTQMILESILTENDTKNRDP